MACGVTVADSHANDGSNMNIVFHCFATPRTRDGLRCAVFMWVSFLLTQVYSEGHESIVAADSSVYGIGLDRMNRNTITLITATGFSLDGHCLLAS